MPSKPASEPEPPASAGKPLLAVPNVSEGRDRQTIDAIAKAFMATGDARLLDTHSDPDHHRSVYTLAGHPGHLSSALLAGACAAIERIDVGAARDPANIGQHPHVGAVDVVPIVYLERSQRGAACAEALVVAAGIGERLEVPVFLYGALADGRSRAELRRGGVGALGERLATGELRPDFGPSRLHPTAGATLVAAREPLVAFNVELAPPATVERASRIAALIRDGGPEGLPGVRAIGASLRGGSVAQVSMNVEHPLEVPLRAVVEAVAKHAEVARAELVGLAPRAALEGFPSDLALVSFDPGTHVIENALDAEADT
jgi:glutamate formiminotransferase/glutamate formiminotransferase/formiminotetrahydrofolate cyclodeaminase